MFYCFNQNNSGGHFNYDEKAGISHYVIIEADSPAEANKRAVEIGLYFDGCEKGWDCDCCGDRWYPMWRNEEGESTPTIYGTPIEEMVRPMLWMDGKPEGFIHYRKGTIEGFIPGTRKRMWL